MKPEKTNSERVNPFDLGSVAKITQPKSGHATTRNFDIYSTGGRNSRSERPNGKIKR